VEMTQINYRSKARWVQTAWSHRGNRGLGRNALNRLDLQGRVSDNKQAIFRKPLSEEVFASLV
jgi:hypothetical protein